MGEEVYPGSMAALSVCRWWVDPVSRGPDKGRAPGFRPHPVEASLYGRLYCEDSEKAPFAAKRHEGKADNDGEDALTGEKQHGNACD